MYNPRGTSTGRRPRPQDQTGHEPRSHFDDAAWLSNGYHSRPKMGSGLPAGDPQDIPRRVASWQTFAACALLIAANAIAVSGARIPFLSPAVGFWFILLYPVYLLYTTSFWPSRAGAERLAYSLAAVLLLLILGGLATNTLLPEVGIRRPLDPIPVAILADALNLSLAVVRRRHPGSFDWKAIRRAITPIEARFIGGTTLSVISAVLGANRLNNGADALVSILSLVCMLFTVGLLLRFHRQVREGVVAATIYGVSLALLLLTSLRGWYITGHDIQQEYRTFQLVVANGRWDFSFFPNPYNGCLSITILPTEFAGVTNFDDAYVYKALFQIMFAFVPVLVFTISRRYWSMPVSILAAIYFISLPNFFTDMTYENRQETAFIFVCAAILAATNSSWAIPRRRAAILIAALGVELSHYSTMYMLVGALFAAWLFGSVLRITTRKRWARKAYSLRMPWSGSARVIGLGTVGVMVMLVFLWGSLVAKTTDGAVRTVSQAASEAFTALDGNGLEYSVLSRTAPSASALLAEYQRDALRENAANPNTYVSAEAYTARSSPQPVIPVTRLGRLLDSAGISVATLNTDVRQGAAKDEQLFIGVGLVVIFLSARLRRRVPREFFCLCLGSAFVMGLFIIFPNLSGDYGVLRAFQEVLIVVAPVLVEGSLAVFGWFGAKWSMRITCWVAVLIFFSTTGLMPQLLGGYAPQLSLDNSGVYYDQYYLHPQEEAAVGWLAGEPEVIPDGLQAPAFVFYFNSPSDVSGKQVIASAFPALIRRSSWVLLNYAIVRDDRAWLDFGNVDVSYVYPMGILETNKDLVYDNGGAEIYR